MQKYLNIKKRTLLGKVCRGMQTCKSQKKKNNTEVTQKDYSINRSKQAAVLTATDIFFYLLRKED